MRQFVNAKSAYLNSYAPLPLEFIVTRGSVRDCLSPDITGQELSPPFIFDS